MSLTRLTWVSGLHVAPHGSCLLAPSGRLRASLHPEEELLGRATWAAQPAPSACVEGEPPDHSGAPARGASAGKACPSLLGSDTDGLGEPTHTVPAAPVLKQRADLRDQQQRQQPVEEPAELLAQQVS